MEASNQQSRLDEIGRTLRHAQATRRTETDSWLNGYQDDVAWLIEQLETLREFVDGLVRLEDPEHREERRLVSLQGIIEEAREVLALTSNPAKSRG